MKPWSAILWEQKCFQLLTEHTGSGGAQMIISGWHGIRHTYRDRIFMRSVSKNCSLYHSLELTSSCSFQSPFCHTYFTRYKVNLGTSNWVSQIRLSQLTSSGRSSIEIDQFVAFCRLESIELQKHPWILQWHHEVLTFLRRARKWFTLSGEWSEGTMRYSPERVTIQVYSPLSVMRSTPSQS